MILYSDTLKNSRQLQRRWKDYRIFFSASESEISSTHGPLTVSV